MILGIPRCYLKKIRERVAGSFLDTLISPILVTMCFEEIWFFFYDNFRAAHSYNAAKLGHGPKGTDLVRNYF